MVMETLVTSGKKINPYFHTSRAYQVHLLKGLGFFHKPIWHFSKKNHGLCSTNIPPCLPPGCSVRKGAVCMYVSSHPSVGAAEKKNVSSHPSVGAAESIGLKCFSSSPSWRKTPSTTSGQLYMELLLILIIGKD